MAFTDVINTTGAIFQVYPELLTYLGPANGDPPENPAEVPAPAPEDLTVFDGVHTVRVVQSASGSRLDFAQIQYHLTASLENRSQPASFSRMVAVHLPDTGTTRIHLGDLVQEEVNVSKDSESLTTQSQLRPYHFGDAVEGYKVYNPASLATEVIEDDIIFNPSVDDITRGNRSSRTGTPSIPSHIWTHPEVADNTAGQAYQDQTRHEWTLQQAVAAMCDLLNPNDTHIERPASYTALSTAPPVRDITVKIGQRLDQVLDAMLIPMGFNWFIDYENTIAPTLPQIAFFEIGVGTEKELKFQAAGSTLDLEFSNCNQFETSNAIGDSFNEVLTLGELEESELTIPLYPGWAVSGDELLPEDLAKDGGDYPGNETAWRLFIANEAGDLESVGSRMGVQVAVPDFSTVFETATPHRRVLGEPLTYAIGADESDSGSDPGGGGSPQRRPVFLEWSADGGETWQAEDPAWSVKMCPNQIGILFDGKEIPEDLYGAGINLRLRITGTIFGDSRLRGLATKQAHSANGRTFRQVLDLPDKFKKRWVQTTGDYASQLHSTGNDADERDDTSKILSYSENIRDKNENAVLDCEFRLPGWHTEYEIGDLITKIAGREIGLDAAAATAPANRYVQIIERIFELTKDGGPSTVLVVDRGVAS